MLKTQAIVILLTILVGFVALDAAAQVHKCTIGGTITYQDDPCPSGQLRKRPTVEQLNADRKKAHQKTDDNPASTLPSPMIGSRPGLSATSGSSTKAEAEGTISTTDPLKAATESFKCDARKYCSQMTSCAEAQYFLARCTNVKMDGDRNGLPCEVQWCKR